MKRIEIPDETPIGLSGNGEIVRLAIFVDAPIELEMSLSVAKVIAASFLKVMAPVEDGEAIG